MKKIEECMSCRFFRLSNGESFEEARKSHEEGITTNGSCHRHCPVAGVPDENDRIINYAYWPAVISSDWCGEYQTIDG